MKNKSIINSLISLLDGYKKISQQNPSDRKALADINYLIGQLIRQYDVPICNIHVSQAADDLWNKLTKKKIDNFWYRENVECDNILTKIDCDFYIGNSKNGTKKTLRNGDSFIFNKIFHVDHVIPVYLIINELYQLKSIDYSSVEKILNKIHLCRILKSEDRKLGRTKDRSLDFAETIRKVYSKNNVCL